MALLTKALALRAVLRDSTKPPGKSNGGTSASQASISRNPADVRRVLLGEKNKWLFRQCLRAAHSYDSINDLLDVAQTRNDECDPVLDDAEVRKIAASAWGYTDEHIADLSDAWCERFAIIMEGGDVSELEARRIADAELGAAFRLRFMPNER
jgi:hypothetical protein